MNISLLLLGIVEIFLFHISGCADGLDDTRGTSFVVGFLGTSAGSALEISVVPQSNSSFTITVSPASSKAPLYTGINNGSDVTKISIPYESCMGPGIEDKGILVETSLEVVIYVSSSNGIRRTNNTYIALPLDVLGTEYHVISYLTTHSGNVTIGVTIGVIAPYDNTDVTVRVPRKKNITLFYNGTSAYFRGTLAFRLNKLQTFQMWSVSDVTGVVVVASKPVIVLTGLAEFVSLKGIKFVNTISTEQLLPTHSWGKKYVTIPVENATEVVRVLAKRCNTSVQIRSSNILKTITLNSGEHTDFPVNNSLFTIEASAPVSAIQVMLTAEPRDCNTCILPPVEQYPKDYVFAGITDSNVSNFIYVVIPSTLKYGLTFDDKNVTDIVESWPTYQCFDEAYSVGYLTMNSGIHKLSHDSSSGKFSAVLWASSKNNKSFLMPLGMHVFNISEPCYNCCSTVETQTTCGNKTTYEIVTYTTIPTSTPSVVIHKQPTLDDSNSPYIGNSSEGLGDYKLAIIISLCCAVLLVLLCILGFALAELYCGKRDDFRSTKVTPFGPC